MPGRSQYRMPPIIGANRNVSGIEPAPRPITSHSIVHTTSFWNTIGSVHQSPKSPMPPSPGVVAPITNIAPST